MTLLEMLADTNDPSIRSMIDSCRNSDSEVAAAAAGKGDWNKGWAKTAFRKTGFNKK